MSFLNLRLVQQLQPWRWRQ